ncbi:hypothetical protein SDJN02_08106, partial [Cucurbita argyrosperma subsp. argyrosperma]
MFLSSLLFIIAPSINCLAIIRFITVIMFPFSSYCSFCGYLATFTKIFTFFRFIVRIMPPISAPLHYFITARAVITTFIVIGIMSASTNICLRMFS